MESVLLGLVLHVICIIQPSPVFGLNDGTAAVVVDQLRHLEREVNELNVKVPSIEKKLQNNLKLSEQVLKEELQGYIDRRIRDAIADLFRDKTFEAFGDNEVETIQNLRVRHNQLKVNQQYMEYGINQMRIEFNKKLEAVTSRIECPDVSNNSLNVVKVKDDLQEAVKDLNYSVTNMETRINDLEKGRDILREENTHVNVSLSVELEEIRNILENSSRDLENVKRMVLVHSDKLDNFAKQQNNTLGRLQNNEAQNMPVQNYMTLQEKSEPVTSTIPTLPSLITHQPEVRAQPKSRSQLLVIPFGRNASKYILDINSNENVLYNYLHIGSIDAVTYSPKYDALVFSRKKPSGIFSAKLHSTPYTVLRLNVRSFGLKIDNGQQLLFFTTYWPKFTVSRMTTDGRNFVSMKDVSKLGGTPIGIDIDPRKKMVYVSNHVKVFSMTYEGRFLKILSTGKNIRGLTLDPGRGFLYFNNLKFVMRRPLTGGSQVKVGEVPGTPLNMKYHNNTVYISYTRSGEIHALYRYFENDSILRLTTFKDASVICVVP